MNTTGILLGCLIGIWVGICLTVGVYPCILRYRAKKLLERCSDQTDALGTPLGNYLSLMMFQATQAYECLLEQKTDEAQAEIAAILAGYASFLTINGGISPSEQGTLDAIRRCCSKSDVLQQAFDSQVGMSADKTTEQILEELEAVVAHAQY